MINQKEETLRKAVVAAVNSLIDSRWRSRKSEQKLDTARAEYLSFRNNMAPRVAVSGSNLSINAAGRAKTLRDIYACSFDTTLIGFIYQQFGAEIWPPLSSSDHGFEAINVDMPEELPTAALNFVISNPFDVVHLSKPRFSNVLLGMLYKVIWGSTVIMDVDDEDLGLLPEKQTTLDLLEFLDVDVHRLKRRRGFRHTHGSRRRRRLRWRKLAGLDGVRVGIPHWNIFDGVTVSNSALKEKYGGIIIPHARNADEVRPSWARRSAVRKEHGIPKDAFVFLFFGTARKHKGLVETARSIAESGRPNTYFVVAGDIDQGLREELQAIRPLNLMILPMQPYEKIPDIVGLADACVLMQSPNSLLANFQFPAKLVDALAMELVVFLQDVPAVREIIEAGCVIPVTRESLSETISDFLSSPEQYTNKSQEGRRFFLDHLSEEVCCARLDAFVAEVSAQTETSKQESMNRARVFFEEIGGWPELVGA